MKVHAQIRLVAALCLLVQACVPAHILQPTNLDPRAPIDDRIIVADPSHSDDAIADDAGPFISEFGRALPAVIAESSLMPRMRRERDVTGQLPVERTFLVRYRVENLTATTRSNRRYVATMMTCMGSLFAIFPACIGMRNQPIIQTVRLSVEMRVFDVSGRMMDTTTDPATGDVRSAVNIENLAAIATKNYEIEVVSERGRESDEDAVVRLNGAVAEELSRRLVIASEADLRAALTAPAPSTTPW